MKRRVALFLSLLLFCAVFTGCSGQPQASSVPESSPASESPSSLSATPEPAQLPVLSLCVDVAGAESRDVRSFLERVPGFERDFRVEYDLLSNDPAERENQLTRVRTEIMAGKGPDVFISYIPPVEIPGGALFHYPEKAMLNRVFLPLDDYIAKAQYMNMDKLLPAVMEAGKSEEGQMLLPLSFNLVTYLIDPAQNPLPPEFPTSWEEMAESENPLLVYAAGGQLYTWLLGQLADFKTEELNYTEEELLDVAKKVIAVQEKISSDGFLSQVNTDAIAVGYGDGIVYHKLDDSAPVYTAIPPYNLQGGLTASVTAFAAINRNTQNPDTAFLLLDVLLSKQTQQNANLYASMDGMPTHMDLGQSGDKARSLDGFWYMNEGNYQNYLEMRDKINVAKFRTPLDDCLDRIQFRSVQEDAPIEKIVHEEYTTMQMMLAES